MPFLYDKYCYPDSNTVVKVFNSVTPNDNPFSSGSSSSNWAALDNNGSPYYVVFTFNTTTQTWTQVSTIPPRYFETCTTVGPLDPDHADAILTVSDANTTAWLIISAFASAWAIRSLTRSI